MLVRDWMIANPTTVTPDTLAMDAEKLMRDAGFRRLPVVHEGRLVGIVTDRDLKEASPSAATSLSAFEWTYLLSRLVVRDVMSAPVVTIRADERLERAATMMADRKIGGLPVMDGDVLVGILTVIDLLEALVSELALREGGELTALTPPPV